MKVKLIAKTMPVDDDYFNTNSRYLRQDSFETHKGKLENKDINQYKSLSDVEDAVEPHLGTTTNRQEKKAIKNVKF